MDHLRELAVREAMFEHLRALVVQSSNRYLTWQQTADFSFAGETIVMRQTRGHGIHKPRQLVISFEVPVGPASRRGLAATARAAQPARTA